MTESKLRQSQEKRQHPRVEVSLAVELRHDGTLYIARAQDLSEGGAGLLLRKAIPEDVEVSVSLVLSEDGIADPDQPPLECAARVMWTAEQSPGAISAGIRFVNLDDASKLRVRWFVAQLTAS